MQHEEITASVVDFRLFLKEFCIEFLNSSYNPLMRHAKDVLVRARAQQNDESYYLWALKFFMEFNRAHDFRVGLVRSVRRRRRRSERKLSSNVAPFTTTTFSTAARPCRCRRSTSSSSRWRSTATR